MKHKIFGDVVMVPVASIRELPRNKTIHADFDAAGRDAWLVENLRKHGVLEPLLIKPDRELIGGHRRLSWARLDGIEQIPCIVVDKDCADSAYISTQLARHVPLYAKCVLYRERLNELVARGRDRGDRNLRQNTAPDSAHGNGDDNALNQDWIKCEEVLGVSRRYLVAGVKLLGELEVMQTGGQPDQIDRAARVLSIFRNRGLKPAMRMMGQSTATADESPDCIDWQSDDEEESTVGKRPKVLKYAKKDEHAEPVEPWVAEILKHLGRVEALAKKNDAYGPVIQASLNAIENDITGKETKRVA